MTYCNHDFFLSNSRRLRISNFVVKGIQLFNQSKEIKFKTIFSLEIISLGFQMCNDFVSCLNLLMELRLIRIAPLELNPSKLDEMAQD